MRTAEVRASGAQTATEGSHIASCADLRTALLARHSNTAMPVESEKSGRCARQRSRVAVSLTLPAIEVVGVAHLQPPRVAVRTFGAASIHSSTGLTLLSRSPARVRERKPPKTS